MENKNWPVLLGSIGLVVTLVLGAGFVNLYSKNKELEKNLNSILYPSILNAPSTSSLNLWNKVDALEKQLATSTQNIDQTITRTVFQDSGVQELLYSPPFVRTWENAVQDQYKNQYSRELNGGLRLMAPERRIFSFDIDSSLYKQFPHFKYIFPRRDVYANVANIGTWILQNDKSETLSIDFPFVDNVDSKNAHCASVYNTDTQLAASIFKNHFANLVDFEVDLEKIDLCKYVIPQKQLREVVWSGTVKPNLLAPKIAAADEFGSHLYNGFIFDSERFYKEQVLINPNNIWGKNPAPRLFAAISHVSSGVPNQEIPIFRLIEVNWSLSGRGDGYSEESKEFQTQVNSILDKTIKSIADTSLLLPECSYFCAY